MCTRGGDVLPRGVEEVAAQAALRREADGVQHAVEAVEVLAAPGRRGESRSLGVGDVELDHRRRLGSRLAIRSTRLSRPNAGEHDLRALLLRQPGHVERDGRVGRGTSAVTSRPVLPSSSSCHASVPHAEAAVDGDHRPGDVGGVVARRGSATTPATSSGVRVPAERDLLAGSAPCAASSSTAVMSVSTKPGATTLAVIAASRARGPAERARPTSPALEAA